MSGEKKASPVWPGWIRGVLLAVGGYLIGVLLLAWGMTAGAVGEDRAVSVLAFLAALSAFLGGAAGSGRRRGMSLAAGGCFALLLAAAGLAVWGEISWNGSGGILLICALAGGALAELLCGRRVQKRRRR